MSEQSGEPGNLTKGEDEIPSNDAVLNCTSSRSTSILNEKQKLEDEEISLSDTRLNRALSSSPPMIKEKRKFEDDDAVHHEISDEQDNVNKERDQYAARLKLSITNLPKFWDQKAFFKWLKLINVTEHHKAVKIPMEGRATLSFDNESMLNEAKNKLVNQEIKGISINVRLSNSNNSDRKSMLEPKKPKIDGEADEKPEIVEDIVDKTTPWYKNIPYDQQLVKKDETLKKECYRKIMKEMNKLISSRQRAKDPIGREIVKNLVKPDWLNCGTKIIPWEVSAILPSPKIIGYRNKCEFSIGPNSEGVPTVGFRLRSFRQGSVCIEGIAECVNVTEKMKSLVAKFQEFILSSPLKMYDLLHHTGVWRQLMLRQSESNGEMLACIMVSLKCLDREIQWNPEAIRLVNCLKTEVSSLSVLVYDGLSNPECDATVEILHGAEYIKEKLLNVELNISATSFFQVNSMGAEVLFEAIIEAAMLTKDTLLLDVCCGTGSIGLCCAKATGCEVIGIEMAQSAVNDAIANAAFNNIDNAKFICEKMEVAVPGILAEIGDKEIVVVVDPPRAGLHPACLRSLKSAEFVKRIVYVSCNPTASLPNDVVLLCCPPSKKYAGTPFKPKRTIPVDMFPHTSHCEVVMVLER